MQKIQAKKSLGQNFLQDKDVLQTIAESITVKGRHIIEVGPGYGALTDYLIGASPKQLDLIELDIDMVNILVDRFSLQKIDAEQKSSHTWWKQWMGAWEWKLSEWDESSISDGRSERVFSPSKPFASFQLWKERGTEVNIYHQDILTFTPPNTPYSVIANIPYYITSPILFHFLYPHSWITEKSQKQEIQGRKIFSKGFYTDVNDWEINFSNDEVRCFSDFSSPENMVILMQREVWEKILEWRAKKPHHSYLSLALEEACESIEPICLVPRTAFSPAPKVDSIVLKFVVKRERNTSQESALLDLWKVAFTHPRKTLLSNLKWSQYDMEKVKSWLTECGYDERVRAEAVKREDWRKLIS